MFKNHFVRLLKEEKTNTGFTLIELLVVIAIIGILSSVIVVSVNAAREKSKIVSIKSALKQLYNQASLNQLEYGSFVNSNPSSLDLDCTGPGGNLAKIAKPLIDQGIFVKCFSLGYSPFSDVHLRFGATALLYDALELKAWSVDENGISEWDKQDLSSVNLPGGDTKSWVDANLACSNLGRRLPSIDQIVTLIRAWDQAHGISLPVGFVSYNYWSSTTIPSAPNTSYTLDSSNDYIGATSKTASLYVRCVR